MTLGILTAAHWAVFFYCWKDFYFYSKLSYLIFCCGFIQNVFLYWNLWNLTTYFDREVKTPLSILVTKNLLLKIFKENNEFRILFNPFRANFQPSSSIVLSAYFCRITAVDSFDWLDFLAGKRDTKLFVNGDCDASVDDWGTEKKRISWWNDWEQRLSRRYGWLRRIGSRLRDKVRRLIWWSNWRQCLDWWWWGSEQCIRFAKREQTQLT